MATTFECMSGEDVLTFTSTDDAATVVGLVSNNVLGQGVSRTVYALNDSYVLKVNRGLNGFAGSNKSEVSVYNEMTESDRDMLVAKIVFCADDYSWIISERCNEGGRLTYDQEVLAQEYGIRDLHPGNIGRREDGTSVIIDYAYNAEAGETGTGFDPDHESSDHCYYCGDCNCNRCFPEGCDCVWPEGCQHDAYRCEVCLSHREVARDHLRRLNGISHAGRWGGRPGAFTLPSKAVERLEMMLAARVNTACVYDGSRKVCEDHRPAPVVGPIQPNLWGGWLPDVAFWGNGRLAPVWWKGGDVLIRHRRVVGQPHGPRTPHKVRPLVMVDCGRVVWCDWGNGRISPVWIDNLTGWQPMD